MCENVTALHQFPLDCSRFYQCYDVADDLTVFIFSCAPGLYFDEATSSCLRPDEAFCDDPTAIVDTVSGSDNEDGGFFAIKCSGDLFRYPLDCRNFYQCFKDEEGIRSIFVFSCVPGFVFDDGQKKCVQPAESTPCGSDDNYFRVPSLLFNLGDVIEPEFLIPSALAAVQKVRDASSSFQVAAVIRQPHQGERGSVKIRMGYSRERPATSLELPAGRLGKQGIGRPRHYDGTLFGARIVPLRSSKNLEALRGHKETA